MRVPLTRRLDAAEPSNPCPQGRGVTIWIRLQTRVRFLNAHQNSRHQKKDAAVRPLASGTTNGQASGKPVGCRRRSRRSETPVRKRQPQIIQIVKEQRIAHTGCTTTFQREGFRLLIQRSCLDDNLELLQHLGAVLFDVANHLLVIEQLDQKTLGQHQVEHVLTIGLLDQLELPL